MLQFLQQNAVAVILTVVYGGWGLAIAVIIVRHRRYGRTFPPLDPSRVRYRERWASARSHLTWWTRHCNVSGCVWIVVTDDEVRVWLPFPFNIIGYEADLEHCIPRSSILGLEERRHWLGRSLLLDYTDQAGETRRIELQLRRPVEFLKALNTRADEAPKGEAVGGGPA